MRRSSKKMKLISGLICLIAAVFALDTVSFRHGVLDCSQAEVLEVDLEEYIALKQPRRQRASNRSTLYSVQPPVLLRRVETLCPPITFSRATERNRLNGFGGVLRI
jgi:hypothetical protein